MGGGHSAPSSVQNNGVNIVTNSGGHTKNTYSDITTGPSTVNQRASAKGGKTTVGITANVTPTVLLQDLSACTNPHHVVKPAPVKGFTATAVCNSANVLMGYSVSPSSASSLAAKAKCSNPNNVAKPAPVKGFTATAVCPNGILTGYVVSPSAGSLAAKLTEAQKTAIIAAAEGWGKKKPASGCTNPNNVAKPAPVAGFTATAVCPNGILTGYVVSPSTGSLAAKTKCSNPNNVSKPAPVKGFSATAVCPNGILTGYVVSPSAGSLAAKLTEAQKTAIICKAEGWKCPKTTASGCTNPNNVAKPAPVAGEVATE